ncbi:MAG: DNA polymerase/3'-5' exonuclease PolX [Deferribacterota bacterium]|nr:DNA polymerase/3'-5' exonuclease PolX [Deferribacterota bacterium]
MITNDEIANILKEYVVLLKLENKDPFKIRAYERAINNIINLQENIAEYYNENKKLINIDGVGKNIAGKIISIIENNSFEELEALRSKYPQSLYELFKIPSLGVKKIARLYKELGIDNINELEYACKENRLLKLNGFGKKMQDNILEGIKIAKQFAGRLLWADVEHLAIYLKEKIQSCEIVEKLDVAGSFRRKLETVKDLYIVVLLKNDSDNARILFLELLSNLNNVKINDRQEKKIAITINNFPVNIIIAESDNYINMLHYLTGNKDHIEKLRVIADKKGYKLNEYGLFEGSKKIEITSEEEIYRKLDLPYIIPELREGLFEFENKVDRDILINIVDIKGILHIHSSYSDGLNSLEEIVEESRKIGFKYIGISDHSKSAYYAGGLKEDEIIKQAEEIKRLNSRYNDIKILHGIESDIRADGSLDYDDDILEKLDFVIASVHSNFNMSKSQMTERISKAIRNPYSTILGHMTSRLLLSRQPYELDIEKIIEEASKNRVIIELNANPQRLDIDWRYIPYAINRDVMISINPDAHNINGLNDYRYGVYIGRKGLLAKELTLNTKLVDEILNIFKSIKEYKLLK